MKRAASIDALLRKARSGFGELESAYERSLDAMTVSEDLKVDIKNVFENLRSDSPTTAMTMSRCVSLTE